MTDFVDVVTCLDYFGDDGTNYKTKISYNDYILPNPMRDRNFVCMISVDSEKTWSVTLHMGNQRVTEQQNSFEDCWDWVINTRKRYNWNPANYA